MELDIYLPMHLLSCKVYAHTTSKANVMKESLPPAAAMIGAVLPDKKIERQVALSVVDIGTDGACALTAALTAPHGWMWSVCGWCRRMGWISGPGNIYAGLPYARTAAKYF